MLRPSRLLRTLAVVGLGGVLLATGACSDGGSSDDAAPPAASSTTATTLVAVTTTTSPAASSTTASTIDTTATTATPGTTSLGGATGEITVRAKVSSVFASARVLLLDPPVDGYSEAGLTSDTEYRKADGSPGTIQDVDDGSTVEVTGVPGARGSILARLVRIVG